MALAREFKKTNRPHVQCDPMFRKELLDGIGSLLAGDIATAKTILGNNQPRRLPVPDLSVRPSARSPSEPVAVRPGCGLQR
jgi:hypothetical protein